MTVRKKDISGSRPEHARRPPQHGVPRRIQARSRTSGGNEPSRMPSSSAMSRTLSRFTPSSSSAAWIGHQRRIRYGAVRQSRPACSEGAGQTGSRPVLRQHAGVATPRAGSGACTSGGAASWAGRRRRAWLRELCVVRLVECCVQHIDLDVLIEVPRGGVQWAIVIQKG